MNSDICNFHLRNTGPSSSPPGFMTRAAHNIANCGQSNSQIRRRWYRLLSLFLFIFRANQNRKKQQIVFRLPVHKWLSPPDYFPDPLDRSYYFFYFLLFPEFLQISRSSRSRPTINDIFSFPNLTRGGVWFFRRSNLKNCFSPMIRRRFSSVLMGFL